jgi:predicted metal-binding protein
MFACRKHIQGRLVMKGTLCGRGVFIVLTMFFMSSTGVYGLDQPREAWVEPSTIAASQPFALTLHFEQDQCSFDYPKVWAGVDLSTKVITLLYTQVETLRVCKTSSTVGPQFLLAGLPAGSYTIEHGSGPECAVPTDDSAPLCKFYIQRQKLSQKLVVREGIPAESRYWFTPSVVAAGEKFVLELNDPAAQCNVTFAQKSVQVDESNKALYVSFVSVLTRSHCEGQMVPQPFEVPALAEGRYSVYVVDMPDCVIPAEPDGPVCAVKIAPLKLEQTLEVVTSGTQPSVWFEPDTVKADSVFSLQLFFNEDLCRRVFRAMSVQIDTLRHTLYLSYVDMGDILDNICDRPKNDGPLFEVGKLAAGVYSVSYNAWPPCVLPLNPGDPMCYVSAEPTPISKRLVVTEGVTRGALLPAIAGHAAAGVHVVGSVLRIQSSQPYNSAVVAFFDARGRRVVQRSLRAESALALSSLSLRGGAYLVQVELDNGARLQSRFIKE